MMTRIEEIELKIKGLVEEKETLLKIEKKNKAELSFDTQFKKYQQTYTGKQVLESYKFEDDSKQGIIKIYIYRIESK